MSASFPTASGPNTPPSSLAASAFTVSSAFHPDTDEDELDSLPSESGSDSSLEADFSAFNSDEEDESDAEEEWRESMRQLELLLTMVIIPFVGKMLGRKCAYWGMLTPLRPRLENESSSDLSDVGRMGEIHGMEAPIGTHHRQCYRFLSSSWETKNIGRSVMYWLCKNKCPKGFARYLPCGATLSKRDTRLTK
jgi:hypothetical protein